MADIENKPWFPPPINDRPDGYECLIWHRGRWRHVSWTIAHQGWMFGYASAHTIDGPDRLYAPIPWNTPEFDFWSGEKS